MNILIVHAGKGFYGGAEEVLKHLCMYLEDQGHAVQIIIKDSPQNFVGKVGTPLPIQNSWLGFYKQIQKQLDWADIINVHNFPATLMPFPTRKPIVWQCNEPPELFTNWKRKPVEAFNRWWVRYSNMKVVVADRLQAARFETLYGMRPSIVPYGIDYEFWSKGERTNKGFIILQVGHPEFFSRGQEVLRRVKRFISDVELVQVMGKSHKYVRDRYYEASVLIHPIDSQGGWLVPFEAMCTGLPVIASCWFTGMSLIHDNKLGVVDFDPTGSILSKIYQGIDTQHAKDWVKENLTWEKYGEGMLKVFKEAVNEHKESS